MWCTMQYKGTKQHKNNISELLEENLVEMALQFVFKKRDYIVMYFCFLSENRICKCKEIYLKSNNVLKIIIFF